MTQSQLRTQTAPGGAGSCCSIGDATSGGVGATQNEKHLADQERKTKGPCKNQEPRIPIPPACITGQASGQALGSLLSYGARRRTRGVETSNTWCVAPAGSELDPLHERSLRFGCATTRCLSTHKKKIRASHSAQVRMSLLPERRVGHPAGWIATHRHLAWAVVNAQCALRLYADRSA